MSMPSPYYINQINEQGPFPQASTAYWNQSIPRAQQLQNFNAPARATAPQANPYQGFGIPSYNPMQGMPIYNALSDAQRPPRDWGPRYGIGGGGGLLGQRPNAYNPFTGLYNRMQANPAMGQNFSMFLDRLRGTYSGGGMQPRPQYMPPQGGLSGILPPSWQQASNPMPYANPGFPIRNNQGGYTPEALAIMRQMPMEIAPNNIPRYY